MSGHAVYRTMLIDPDQLGGRRWPGCRSASIALRAIIAALREWWRKAELSADRAGLLAGQDPAAALRLAMKLAGGGDLSEVDTTAFLEQAAEYERDRRPARQPDQDADGRRAHPPAAGRPGPPRCASGSTPASTGGSSPATTRAATTTAPPRSPPT